MENINKSIINSCIMALYIFQFGFLQPLASILNSQIPIAGFSILLLLIMLVNNRFRIKLYVVISYIIISIYFLLSTIIFRNSTSTILSIYAEFILKGFSAFIVASMTVDGEDLYDAFLKLAVINFLAIAIFPFTGFLDSMNYMRFGYAMAPSVIMFFYAAVNEKSSRLIWILLTLVSFILTVVYGSRGPLGIFILFALLLFIFSKKIGNMKKLAILFIISIFAVIILKYQLLTKLLDYVYLDKGIRSYALTKFRLMLSEGLAASSSGRDIIYEYLIKHIKDNPFIGYGIGFIQMSLDSTAHNIFLQILIESGILGLLFWSIFWIYCTGKYVKMRVINKIGIFEVTTLLGAVSVGRLLISSDMWLRPEYWFVLSMLINYKTKTKSLKGL